MILQPPPPTHHRNSKSAISQLLLTQFLWKFKCRILGKLRTDSNCHGDIYPGDIYPYQEYLSCYWPNFDETLNIGSWKHLQQIPTVMVAFAQATFVQVTFVHIRKISAVTDPLTRYWPNFKGIFLGPSLALVGLDMEMTLHSPTTPLPTQTQC